MNRKELPREKKLKARIDQLEEDIVLLVTKHNNQESNIKYLSEQLKEQEDKNCGLMNEVSLQLRQIREYEREFRRKQKLIDFLIDSKL